MSRRIRQTVPLAVLVFASLLLGGQMECPPQQSSNPVVGTWISNDGETLVLNSDRTYTSHLDGELLEEGRYLYDPLYETIRFDWRGANFYDNFVSLSDDGDSMTLLNLESLISIAYVRMQNQ